MAASIRLRSKTVRSEDDLTAATSAFIESLLTPKTSISQTTDNKQFSKENASADLQTQPIRSKRKNKSKLVENDLKNESKIIMNKSEDVTITQINIDKTENLIEDNWVCPVAVALRRAGYDVPLRPSKSWLRRDRKQQALLRQRTTSS